MERPEISIIVPVYNAEKYLNICVESILAQNYTNYELLLIDDGSTDGSPVLCDQFAVRDSRIRAIHQENGGVSKARNRGLDEAQGVHVVFVDADDLVRPCYLFDLNGAYQDLRVEGQRALIISDYQPFSDKGHEERYYPKPFRIDFASKQGLTTEHFRELIFQFRVFPPYCKLYNRIIINENQIRFREGMRSAEDFEFNMRYLSAVDSVVYINSVQYEYRVGHQIYVPSNHGVLGESEILSAHIMANEITGLAKRMGILDKVGSEIDLWAANKHYFNRLRMLFRHSEKVSIHERKQLYHALISDLTYYSAARRGAKQLPKSVTKLIAMNMDNFYSWQAFFLAHRYGVGKNIL